MIKRYKEYLNESLEEEIITLFIDSNRSVEYDVLISSNLSQLDNYLSVIKKVGLGKVYYTSIILMPHNNSNIDKKFLRQERKNKFLSEFDLIKQYDYELQADKLESILIQLEDISIIRYTKIFGFGPKGNAYSANCKIKYSELREILEHIKETN